MATGVPYGAVFILVGLCGVALGATSLMRSIRARRWPFVIGQVIEAKVVQHASGEANIDTHVLYRYDVGGSTYRSDRRDFGWRPRPTSVMQPHVSDKRPDLQNELRRHFPARGAVRVYVNPGDPSDSVLDTGLAPLAFAFLGFGVAFVWLGARLIFGM
ncbi:MAG: DUF3592 domain-containing protein [Cytophagaceae bacterium]|nr:DUF3592 domain-containing protein [Gemmatimonadaceae bacterium]